jgi:hypothetical protein
MSFFFCYIDQLVKGVYENNQLLFLQFYVTQIHENFVQTHGFWTFKVVVCVVTTVIWKRSKDEKWKLTEEQNICAVWITDQIWISCKASLQLATESYIFCLVRPWNAADTPTSSSSSCLFCRDVSVLIRFSNSYLASFQTSHPHEISSVPAATILWRVLAVLRSLAVVFCWPTRFLTLNKNDNLHICKNVRVDVVSVFCPSRTTLCVNFVQVCSGSNTPVSRVGDQEGVQELQVGGFMRHSKKKKYDWILGEQSKENVVK